MEGRANEGFPVSAADEYFSAAVMCLVEFEELSL